MSFLKEKKKMSSVNILADIFLTNESQKILKNKFILFIGDSVIRSMYKDMVKLLQKKEHLTDNQLKNKGEFVFENDVLLEGGQMGTLSNDVTYTEVREFKAPFHLVRFYFITRSYSDYLKSICDDIRNEQEKPDLVIMNSGCWDLTRYGKNSIYEYKKNLPLGIYSLIKVLPCYTLFLWATTLPLSKEVRGGFMLPEVEGHQSKLREDVLEANKYAANVIQEYRLDLLDLHYYFRNQIHRRAKDGIHWDATAHRRISNLILHHVCEAWEMETPGRVIMKDEIAKTKNEIDNMNKSFDEDFQLNYGTDIYTNFDDNYQNEGYYDEPQRKKTRNVYSCDSATSSTYSNNNNFNYNSNNNAFSNKDNNKQINVGKTTNFNKKFNKNKRQVNVQNFNATFKGQSSNNALLNNALILNNTTTTQLTNNFVQNSLSNVFGNPFNNNNCNNNLTANGLTHDQSALLNKLQDSIARTQNTFNFNPFSQNQMPLMQINLDNQRKPDHFNRKRKFDDRR